MGDSQLQGRKAVAWLRCSTDRQTETSIPDQETLIARFAKDHGLTIIDSVRMEGVSASVEANIDDAVADLIRRKKARNDFDLIVVHDHSRFSRTGARHSSKLLYELEQAGIPVIPALGYLPKGEYSDIVEAVQFVTSHQQAKALAAATARGSQSALEQGRRAHASIPPFGIDKRILTADKRQKVILRMLPNGVQLQISPRTGEIIERSSFDSNGRPIGRYRKAKEELVELIPGDPEAKRAVCLMFERFYVNKWGPYRIAKELNDLGIRSPRGDTWGIQSVRLIVRNPVYTGKAYANRFAQGIFYQRAPEMPSIAAPRQGRSKKTQSVRPRADWMELDLKYLKDYLPEWLREIVCPRLEEYLAQFVPGRAIGPPKTRHADSEFLLTGILRSRPLELPFSGRRGGRRHGRYYHVARGNAHPTSTSGLGRMVPAEPLEEFVLGALQTTLRSVPQFRAAILEQTRRWQASLTNAVGRTELQAKLDKVNRQMEFVDENIDVMGEEKCRARLAKLGTQRRELEVQLSLSDQWEPLDETEVEAAVDGAIGLLSGLGQDVAELPRNELKGLLRILVESAELNPETREVWVTIRVPSWADVRGEGSLADTTARSSGGEASEPFLRMTFCGSLPPPKTRSRASKSAQGITIKPVIPESEPPASTREAA